MLLVTPPRRRRGRPPVSGKKKSPGAPWQLRSRGGNCSKDDDTFLAKAFFIISRQRMKSEENMSMQIEAIFQSRLWMTRTRESLHAKSETSKREAYVWTKGRELEDMLSIGVSGKGNGRAAVKRKNEGGDMEQCRGLAFLFEEQKRIWANRQEVWYDKKVRNMQTDWRWTFNVPSWERRGRNYIPRWGWSG